MSLSGEVASSVNVLASVLNEIGAAEYLQVFIDDDRDDNSIKTIASFSLEKIVHKYGLPLDKAAAFLDKCRSASSSLAPLPPPSVFALSDGRTADSDDGIAMPLTRIGNQHQSLPSVSLPSARNPIPALPLQTASPLDDAAIMRSLNFEMIRELGRGGFGVVYEVKNLADRLKVALKIVKDPRNAKQAIREGQRLRRVKHKNIVSMHKVHDLGDGSCALEMEVVAAAVGGAGRPWRHDIAEAAA